MKFYDNPIVVGIIGLIALVTAGLSAFYGWTITFISCCFVFILAMLRALLGACGVLYLFGKKDQ